MNMLEGNCKGNSEIEQKIQQNLNSQKIEQQKENKNVSIEQLLNQNQAISKYRKNKNAISPKMSLLTNKLQRNLVRISRLISPLALVDPEHLRQQKQRFLRFYRGRNSQKKPSNTTQSSNQSNQIPNQSQNGTPNKLIKESIIQK